MGYSYTCMYYERKHIKTDLTIAKLYSANNTIQLLLQLLKEGDVDDDDSTL